MCFILFMGMQSARRQGVSSETSGLPAQAEERQWCWHTEDLQRLSSKCTQVSVLQHCQSNRKRFCGCLHLWNSSKALRESCRRGGPSSRGACEPRPAACRAANVPASGSHDSERLSLPFHSHCLVSTLARLSVPLSLAADADAAPSTSIAVCAGAPSSPCCECQCRRRSRRSHSGSSRTDVSITDDIHSG